MESARPPHGRSGCQGPRTRSRSKKLKAPPCRTVSESRASGAGSRRGQLFPRDGRGEPGSTSLFSLCPGELPESARGRRLRSLSPLSARLRPPAPPSPRTQPHRSRHSTPTILTTVTHYQLVDGCPALLRGFYLELSWQNGCALPFHSPSSPLPHALTSRLCVRRQSDGPPCCLIAQGLQQTLYDPPRQNPGSSAASPKTPGSRHASSFPSPTSRKSPSAAANSPASSTTTACGARNSRG